MKKIVLFSLLFLIVSLTACGLIVETRTFNLSQDGISINIEYKSQGKNITEYTGKTSISYEFLGVTSEEDARKLPPLISEDVDSGDGWTQEIEYTDTSVHQSLFVDFQKVDFDEIEIFPGVILNKQDKKGENIQEAIDQLSDN